ncbi:MAG: hypothetical protein Q8L85_03610 [Alphaproteobacteria bacterium]|nr:hypothetical protein [Alphaproteobacteria bacterium]
MKKLGLIAFAILINISSLHADREIEILERVVDLCEEIFNEIALHEYDNDYNFSEEKYKEFLKNLKEAEDAGYNYVVRDGNNLKELIISALKRLTLKELKSFRQELSTDLFQKVSLLSQRRLSYFVSGNFKQSKIIFGERHRLSYIGAGSNVLPEDFNPVIYLSLYPDLQNHADESFTSDVHKMDWATKHYLMHGKNEGRAYLKKVPVDFNYRRYLELYQDLDDHARTLASDELREAFAQSHYLNDGENEGRRYK